MGSQGNQGAQGSQGSQGSQGFQGIGSQGAQGNSGPQGAQGGGNTVLFSSGLLLALSTARVVGILGTINGAVIAQGTSFVDTAIFNSSFDISSANLPTHEYSLTCPRSGTLRNLYVNLRGFTGVSLLGTTNVIVKVYKGTPAGNGSAINFTATNLFTSFTIPTVGLLTGVYSVNNTSDTVSVAAGDIIILGSYLFNTGFLGTGVTAATFALSAGMDYV